MACGVARSRFFRACSMWLISFLASVQAVRIGRILRNLAPLEDEQARAIDALWDTIIPPSGDEGKLVPGDINAVSRKNKRLEIAKVGGGSQGLVFRVGRQRSPLCALKTLGVQPKDMRQALKAWRLAEQNLKKIPDEVLSRLKNIAKEAMEKKQNSPVMEIYHSDLGWQLSEFLGPGGTATYIDSRGQLQDLVMVDGQELWEAVNMFTAPASERKGHPLSTLAASMNVAEQMILAIVYLRGQNARVATGDTICLQHNDLKFENFQLLVAEATADESLHLVLKLMDLDTMTFGSPPHYVGSVHTVPWRDILYTFEESGLSQDAEGFREFMGSPLAGACMSDPFGVGLLVLDLVGYSGVEFINRVVRRDVRELGRMTTALDELQATLPEDLSGAMADFRSFREMVERMGTLAQTIQGNAKTVAEMLLAIGDADAVHLGQLMAFAGGLLTPNFHESFNRDVYFDKHATDIIGHAFTLGGSMSREQEHGGSDALWVNMSDEQRDDRSDGVVQLRPARQRQATRFLSERGSKALFHEMVLARKTSLESFGSSTSLDSFRDQAEMHPRLDSVEFPFVVNVDNKKITSKQSAPPSILKKPASKVQ